MPITEQEQPAGQEFHDRISRRNSGGTAATPPAQQHPAQHWNVVIEPDGLTAIRASRARPHYRQPPRHPVDAHVQEAAERQPQREHSSGNNGIHPASSDTLASNSRRNWPDYMS